MWTKFALIAAAGAAGTLARYGMTVAVQRAAGAGFPWGTLAVNVAGCLLFGLVWGVAESRLPASGETRTILLVGFMGAFTTFSTFAFETGQMLHDARYLLAAGYVAASNVTGIAALIGGMAAGRAI